MDEMIFICEKEEVTVKTLCEVLDKKPYQVLQMGYNVGHNGKFEIDGFTYKVKLTKEGEFEQKIKENKIDMRGQDKRKVFASEAVYYKSKTKKKRLYQLDGVVTTKGEIADKIGISEACLNTYIRNIKSIKINEFLITTVPNPTKFTLVKDGKNHGEFTLEEAIKKTKLTKQQIHRMRRTGNYSIKQGWQVK